MTVYALLDFDGYICKAFWAANSKKSSDKDAYSILSELYYSAVEKAAKYFEVSEDEIIPVLAVSGHSWKKDVYPSYKAQRKKNEELGKFRDEIISQDSAIIKIDQLEADEVILMLNNFLIRKGEQPVIFSDDKDLKYYASTYCKINIAEEVRHVGSLDNWEDIYVQMLAGDKEDNITGIKGVGMKTAKKLINQTSGDLTLEKIIRIYRNQNIPYNDCLKQLALVIPVCGIFENDPMPAYLICDSILNNMDVDDLLVQQAIENLLKTIKDKVDLVYG